MRRFLLLTGFSGIGALLFVPFLQAGAPSALPAFALGGFAAVATTIAAVSTWFGLGWADRAMLPMPLLRAVERRSKLQFDRTALTYSIAGGAAFGLTGLVALRLLHLPSSAAAPSVRVGSAVFAAITLEVVIHLAVMSGVALATRRVILAIGISTVVYVVFHLATLGGQPIAVVTVVALVNGLGGLLFGSLYAFYGFEYLIMAHFVAHAITVGFA